MSIFTLGAQQPLALPGADTMTTLVDTITAQEESSPSSSSSSAQQILASVSSYHDNDYQEAVVNNSPQISPVPTTSIHSRSLSFSSTREIKSELSSSDPCSSTVTPPDLNEKQVAHDTTSTPPLEPSDGPTTVATAPTVIVEPASWREGGLKGWLAVLGSLLMHSFVFVPTEFIFGIFALEYSLKFPSANPSTIALIGTIGTSMTYLVGFAAGACSDRWGYRITACVGTMIMALSLVLASFSTQLWHYYFSQGILFGTGASLSYFSAIAAPTHWFKRKRGLAMGIAASGAGLGGFILAPVAQHLVDKVGVEWTLRILGIWGFVVCGTASLLLFQKDPSEQQDQIRTTMALNRRRRVTSGKLTIFKLPPFAKDWGFWMLVAFQFLFSIAYLTPIYSIEMYSTFIGLTTQKGATVNGWFNGASFIARILCGFLADVIATDVVLLICIWTNALSVLVIWTLATSFPVYMLFSVIYGISFSGTITLTPAMVAEHYGPAKVSRVLGFAFSCSCAALLCGSLISGHILEMTKPRLSYLPVIMYTGGMFAFSGLCASTWVFLMRRQRKAEASLAESTGSTATASAASV